MPTKTIEAFAPRTIPPPTLTSAPFWSGGKDGELRVLRDSKSGRYVHPFDEHYDGVPALDHVALSGKGTVFSYTVNYQPYHPKVPTPYVLAIVQLAEQEDLRVYTNIVNCDPESVRIGMPVQVVFEKNGDNFVPLFEPA